MNRQANIFLRSVGLEVLIYGVLTTAYFFLVLHLMGNWLYGLFAHDRKLYAGMTIVLLVAQGALLEQLTRILLGFIKPGGEEKK